MKRLSLDDIVKKVHDLPALPQVTFQVIKMADDPNSTAQDINAVITKDQSLTAKVLRLANSAFYGFPRRISTVTEATILLGFNTIKSIVMAASVSEVMTREVSGYALASGELWRHSQAAAIAARLLARRAKYPNPDVAYTGALLHDIGKVVLNSYLKDSYREVVSLIEEGVLSFPDAEREVLGFTHAEIGARVAENWNLPEELVESIAYHHSPELSKKNQKLTYLVHIADATCLMMGVGLGIDGLYYPVSELALQALGSQAAELDDIISNLTDVFADENGFLA